MADDDEKQAIRMTADRLLVVPSQEAGDRKSRAGILIPATASVNRRLVWGEVVETGPTVRTIEQSDRVLFAPDSGYEVDIRGEEYLILRERDVHAVASTRGRTVGPLPVITPDRALRLDGKVVLVTGGTRGIGRAIAEAAAAAGAGVSVLARKPAELEETAAALGALDAPVCTVEGSVGNAAIAEIAVTQTIETLGRCDAVVNNAAINPVFAPLMEADLEAVAKIWDANIAGPLRFTRAAWHAWMREHGGTVLNVVSVGGMRPGPFIGAYNVSKAALIHLTRQLAQELAPGVRVNAVAPGLVKTDMARALWEPNEDAMARAHALGRLGVPDDIASAALFLLSDSASWLTGEVLVVDGGAGVSSRG